MIKPFKALASKVYIFYYFNIFWEYNFLGAIGFPILIYLPVSITMPHGLITLFSLELYLELKD